jgi:hypothetical protein
MIVLAGSQTWNYDYGAYRYYYNVSGTNVLSGVEIGFEFLASFSKNIILLDYEQFRYLFFFIMFSVAGIYIWKLSERPCFVQLLYFILFFAVNITQIRSGMSEAFVLASIYYLQQNKKIKYFIVIFLAISFHYSALFFILFSLLFFEKIEVWLEKNKKGIAITSCVLLVAFRTIGALTPMVVSYINSLLGNDYRASANFAEYAGNHYIKYLPVPIMTIAIFYMLRNVKENDESFSKYELVAFISLLIYPLFTINRQLSRLSRTVVIISLIPFTKYLLLKCKIIRYMLVCSMIVFIGYDYYCLSAYTSCLDALLHHSALSVFFG